tara:strand:+ start:182 stop:442 length:261 start_codon:yes stop_codon:yes gene_type:complete
VYPFLSKPKYRDPLLNEINIKIRKKSLISELDSELESGILSIDLYNQLKDDVEKMMQLELQNLDQGDNKIDPIEKIIQFRKNEKDK